MKILKHIVNWILWTFVGLYVLTMGAIHVPWVQQQMGDHVSRFLARKLGTEVSIGRVDLGFLNRLILDDIIIYDQEHRKLLKATRLTAKADLGSLAFGRIVVSSAQVFGAHLQLSRPSADAPLNAQFVLDALASSDTTSQSPVDLRINSLIIRRSSMSYDQQDMPLTPDTLNLKHLNINNVSAHVIVKIFRDDSLNVNVKRLSFIEQSGADVRRLSFHLAAGPRGARLQEFRLQLPATDLNIDSIQATYDYRQWLPTLNATATIADESYLTPSDLRFLLPRLKTYQHRLTLGSSLFYRDSTISVPHLAVSSTEGNLKLDMSGHFSRRRYGHDSWQLCINQLDITDEATDYIAKNLLPLPEAVRRLGDIHLEGTFEGDAEGALHANADASTSIGHATARFTLHNRQFFDGHFSTDSVDIGQLLASDKLGLLAADLDVCGTIDKALTAKGHIARIDYGNESYTNINIDGHYGKHQLQGTFNITDPKLTARAEMNLTGTGINDAVGSVALYDLNMPHKDYRLNRLLIETGFDEGRHFLTLTSDFAEATLRGEFNISSLSQSLANAVGSRLPTLPGMPPLASVTDNNLTLHLHLTKSDWLQRLLGIELDIHQPVSLNALLSDRSRQLQVNLQAPAFAYNGHDYRQGILNITSPSDTLLLNAAISSYKDDAPPLTLSVDGHAADNNITFALAWDNNSPTQALHGTLNAQAQLYRNADSQSEAHISIRPSDITIANSEWHIEPSNLYYTTDRLIVSHFTVHNGNQHLELNGRASKTVADSIVADLNGVEVAYILDLVDFDAVSFSGHASGRAVLASAFSVPRIHGALTVSDFKFEHGRMGTLTANVAWNEQQKQIDISATADDGPDAKTYINGYVSPDREYIDLAIQARGSYLDFMHNYTESFISTITGHGRGNLRLAGPLSAINLTGGLRVDGEATITPLNTTYHLRNDTITFVHNEIQLDSVPIYDRYDNVAYLTGAIHHKDLTSLSLDLRVDTQQILGYDFHDFGDQSFYGTVFAAGTVNIAMKGDDVHIDCNLMPLKNTVFTYNAAQTDAIATQEFIQWRKSQEQIAKSEEYTLQSTLPTTNIYMTFLINVTPDATMRLLMDAKTGDYITLNGTGALQASYYNKGSFQMFGTYTVESGTYDVTIQNIIKKNFLFQPDGTIIFGGDPYDAALNLQALYTVNGVSLSDLQMGNSFSSNTVRVNCLMNIGGQPAAPRVTFDLDLPTVNADEKQMVRSLLSSQQEMNQQVLYLLGIGRFYNQGQNNADQQQRDQTSLAMQSFLSGTLSTQINSVINQIVKNDDWNFGANISTGTEGWNNAEYEGIVNGRMLNNRLLINGQFGYRDNATKASPSFIGDFDIRYLLVPNGNLALKVYNQTNDRYFTRSSLNTQGLGIILKRDFNGLGELFGRKKEKVQTPSPDAAVADE